MTFPLTIAALLSTAFSISARSEEALIRKVDAYLETQTQAVETEATPSSVREVILARPDPGTFFLRYAFGLKRHAKKLLTQEQTARLHQVLEQHARAHQRWHDERNTLRCKFNAVMWLHAAATAAEAPKLRAALGEWMRLRMAWTRQEHLAQFRFAREVWQVLTAEQQAHVLAGDWKAYATQDTGHSRGDATAKIITRALGKAADPSAFESALQAWSQQRQPLHDELAKAEEAERRIVFAMDLNSEGLVMAANAVANAAYARLYLAEAEALRRIVQAAYHAPEERCRLAAQNAWDEAAQRFLQGAQPLHTLLTES